MVINYNEIPAFIHFVNCVRRDYARFRELNPEITGKKLREKFSKIIENIYNKYIQSDIFLEKNGTLGNFKSNIVKEIRRAEKKEKEKIIEIPIVEYSKQEYGKKYNIEEVPLPFLEKIYV